jgi:hypothetical protein
MQHYKNCNFEDKEEYRVQYLIRSYNHELYTIEQNKKALSPNDDKQYICPDKIHILHWGHYNIPEIENWKTLPLVEV